MSTFDSYDVDTTQGHIPQTSPLCTPLQVCVWLETIYPRDGLEK